MVMIAGRCQHRAIDSINILMRMHYGVKFKPRITERQFDAVSRPRLASHECASRGNLNDLLFPANSSPAEPASTLPQDGCIDHYAIDWITYDTGSMLILSSAVNAFAKDWETSDDNDFFVDIRIVLVMALAPSKITGNQSLILFCSARNSFTKLVGP